MKRKYDIIIEALFGRLERVPTFLVPKINPPFADKQPALHPMFHRIN